MSRFLWATLAAAAVGALVAIFLNPVLRDAQGFLSEQRPAIVGGVAGAAAVLVVRLFFRSSRKGK